MTDAWVIFIGFAAAQAQGPTLPGSADGVPPALSIPVLMALELWSPRTSPSRGTPVAPRSAIDCTEDTRIQEDHMLRTG